MKPGEMTNEERFKHNMIRAVVLATGKIAHIHRDIKNADLSFIGKWYGKIAKEVLNQ